MEGQLFKQVQLVSYCVCVVVLHYRSLRYYHSHISEAPLLSSSVSIYIKEAHNTWRELFISILILMAVARLDPQRFKQIV